MALPSTGPIALSDVNTILSYTSTRLVTLDDIIVRSLFQKPLGTIAMADGRGKAVGGSQSFTTAGTSYFTVPAYLNMNITVNGGGGGGDGRTTVVYKGYNEAGLQYYNVYGGAGGSGSASSFGSPTPIVGNGGGGGNNTGGTATGPTVSSPTTITFTTGGGAAGGAAGGGTSSTKGGAGGKAVLTGWNRELGGPTVGSVIPIVVGAGGAGGSPSGGNGVTGNVIISWS